MQAHSHNSSRSSRLASNDQLDSMLMSSSRRCGTMCGKEGKRSRRGIVLEDEDEATCSGTGASSRSLILGRPLLDIDEMDERGVAAFDHASISASGATIEHNESECRSMLVRC